MTIIQLIIIYNPSYKLPKFSSRLQAFYNGKNTRYKTRPGVRFTVPRIAVPDLSPLDSCVTFSAPVKLRYSISATGPHNLSLTSNSLLPLS
jgi:hypothetical protein